MGNPESIICKNCENIFIGLFCNNCGQKYNNQRLTFKLLLHDLVHGVTHLDKGYLFTIKEMAVRPGHTVRDYINGKRAGHANPLVMLLIIGGLCSLLYMRLNLRMLNSYNANDLPESLHAVASKSFALSMLAYCFLFAAIDRIAFSYKKYNYTELFVLNAFICVEVLVVEIGLVPMWLAGRLFEVNTYLRAIIALVFFVYFMMVRYQFFEVANDFKTRKRWIWVGVIFICLWFIGLYKTVINLL